MIRGVHLLAVAALLLTALLPPTQANHPQGGFIHVNPWRGTLAPGANETIPLDFERGPFEKGWEFVVSAVVLSNGTTLTATLTFENRTVQSWRVAPGGTRHLSTVMPETGFYSLVMLNDGNETIRYAFFYDQSCDCAGKPIPFEIDGGIVIFNQDLEPGQKVKAVFYEPPAMAVKIWLAKRTGTGGAWPRDFTVLSQSFNATVVRDPEAPTEGEARFHEFAFTADETTRYYYFVQSKVVFLDRLQSPNDVFVIPQFKVSYDEQPVKQTPLDAWPALTAIAAAAFVFSARRR